MRQQYIHTRDSSYASLPAHTTKNCAYNNSCANSLMESHPQINEPDDELHPVDTSGVHAFVLAALNLPNML